MGSRWSGKKSKKTDQDESIGPSWKDYYEQTYGKKPDVPTQRRRLAPNMVVIIVTCVILIGLLFGAIHFVPILTARHPGLTPTVAVTHPISTAPSTSHSTITPTPHSTPRPTPRATTIVKNPCTYRGHTNEILSVAWSPLGTRVASSDKDGTMLEWDPATCQTVATFTVPGGIGNDTSVAWSPDGKYIAVSREDATVVVWNAATRELVTTYNGHLQKPVNGVAWSPDSQNIASVSDDHTLQVWKVSTTTLLYSIVDLGVPVDAVAWSYNGNYIATGSIDGTVQIWDATNGQLVMIYKNAFTGNANKVNAVAWSHNNQFVAAASSNQTLKVWDVTTRSQAPVATFSGNQTLVLSLAWSPDDKRIAYGTAGDYVFIVSFPGRKLLSDYKAQTNWVYGVAWSPDGKWVAAGSADFTVDVRAAPS